jgi:HAD superfamily hydrolase (TIGR01509 family)
MAHNRPPRRALIFDMDGLLVDTEPLYWDVARAIARRYGRTLLDSTLRKMMGRSRLESMQIFIADCSIDAEPDDLLIERERMMLERYVAGVTPMLGVHEILTRFHGRLNLAVATSSPRKFTDVLLPSLGIANYFDIVQTGDDITRGKPDPEIYMKCMSRLNVGPNQCVVLEDSHAGALSAHRAGAYVIAVPSALTVDEDFSFVDDRADNLYEAAERVEHLIAAQDSRPC